MFQRVILESWHSLVPYVAFVLVAGSFLAILIRVATMKGEEADHLAHLPLDKPRSETPDPPSHS